MKTIKALTTYLLVVLLAGAVVVADNPSGSKISIHLIMAYTNGAAQIIGAHPRLLKILGTDGTMMQAARDFKTGTPGGKVVVRIYTTVSYTSANDPAASAQDFWNRVLAPALTPLSPADKALIDYVEGPNEADSTPTWGSVSDAQWYNTFWVNLAPLIANAGFKPCAFSISVGNPPGTTAYIQSMLDSIVPALRLCKSYGGGWSYHSYTVPYTTDVTQEIWYSLRYRQYYSYFATAYPDLVNLPILLTEGGVDNGNGWNYPPNGGAAKFENWLQWYDQQIGADSYVVGCTLFEIGSPGAWPTFDVEPIAGWLANYLTTIPNGPPAAPTALTATAGNAQVSLSWAGSVGATSYNVKSSTTSGGPYTIIASGVTTSSYLNTGLNNGTTYYYVVSAVNTAGESPNSQQASATPSAVISVTENFETMPAWSSSYDATWGGAATWSIVTGGQSGNCLQASRTVTGSSAKVNVYTISANANYTISAWINCPSSSPSYWVEFGYKLGNFTAQDFDTNVSTWTEVQKFSDTGTNGNGGVWTQYSLTFNSGTNTQISVGFKQGASTGTGPVAKWDTLQIQ